MPLGTCGTVVQPTLPCRSLCWAGPGSPREAQETVERGQVAEVGEMGARGGSMPDAGAEAVSDIRGLIPSHLPHLLCLQWGSAGTSGSL